MSIKAKYEKIDKDTLKLEVTTTDEVLITRKGLQEVITNIQSELIRL